MDTHKFEVHQISKQIKSFHAQQNPFNIHHGATYSSRIRPDPQAVVLTTHLDHILEVNTSSQYTIVEPNVSLDQLLKKTLKHGLMPPVVPHFPGLTVGGCFAGTAGSSSSFRQGFFDEAISWAEIVLPDGNVTIASRTQGADLLSGMVGSLGSIGVATLFQIKLVPATHWVELTYVPVKTVDEAVETISTLCQEANNDFVEGLVYGPKASTYGVIAVGKLVEGKEHPQVGFSKPNDDWFYQHALAAGGSPRTESITTTDYLFRHDRGTFCMGRYCFGNMPFNKLTRCITDSATRSHALTKTSHELDWPEHFIQQDVVVPLEKSWEMINFLDGTLRIYPLSLCPVRQWPDNRIIMRPNPHTATLSLSIAIRGYTHATLHNAIEFEEKNMLIEHAVHRLGGFKWLYSRNYYTEDEFWNLYSRTEYEELRKKYGAEYLEDVFRKSMIREEGVKRGRRKAKVKGLWAKVFERTSVVAFQEEEEGEGGDGDVK